MKKRTPVIQGNGLRIGETQAECDIRKMSMEELILDRNLLYDSMKLYEDELARRVGLTMAEEPCGVFRSLVDAVTEAVSRVNHDSGNAKDAAEVFAKMQRLKALDELAAQAQELDMGY
jgi:hypothetical protein